MSVGLGLLFVPVSTVGLSGVAPHDAGVASAMLNTTQQVGGALGPALLTTLYVSALAGYLASNRPGPAGRRHRVGGVADAQEARLVPALQAYAPTAKELPSALYWHNYRVNGLLGSDEEPPYDYLVTLEVADKARLGENVAGERMIGWLSELHGYADVTQLMAERFV
jgi:hypothetical protein